MGNLFRSIMLTKILIISVFLIAALVACQGPRGEAGPPGEKGIAGAIGPRWPQGPQADHGTIDEYGLVVQAHEQVMVDIYQSLLPSVVRIEVTNQPRNSSTLFESKRGEGSGFVWSSEGHIVTNHHVVDGGDGITIVFEDGSEYEGRLIGSDPDSDLAVLKIAAPPGYLSPVRLGDSSSVKVGQFAVAIGTPFGQSFSMTGGIVSALGRLINAPNGSFSIPQVIQTDAPINPGNSGGPLLDRNGDIIGINSQIISYSGSSSGVGFAVPINMAKLVIPDLIKYGKFDYPYIGISGVTLRPKLNEINRLPSTTRGVLVVDVIDGGPADVAGINGGDYMASAEGSDLTVGGDVITAIEGTDVQNMSEIITYLLENNRPGDEVTLSVFRNQNGLEELLDEVRVRLGQRPESPQKRPS